MSVREDDVFGATLSGHVSAQWTSKRSPVVEFLSSAAWCSI